ncbi:MAG: D-alanyl-D-alanine carboxypeptidase/D-alanyl-D-alanine-endopeptidase [Planctomycetota bacterium]|nr:D-alanyl-D-alanine carboxypeptidase/D-alanyl-D-alanine-endopeptidase [Planctomycetota bacterium]
MRRVRLPFLRLLAVVLLGGLLGGTPDAAAQPDARLAAKIRQRLAKAGIKPGRYGISVLERGAVPSVVFAEGHLEPLIPASVAKVLAAAAALDVLGPGHRFETLVSALGRIENGVLHGDLVVHGAGDPGVQATYAGEDDPRYALLTLAKGVRAAGIRRVTGSVLLDEGPFDREFTHDSWTDEDVRSHYGAGVAGLTFHEGCLQVRVTGAPRLGSDPVLHFATTPGPYTWKLDAKTQAGKRSSVGAAFTGTPPRLRVWGKAAPKKAAEMKVPVPDPVLFFGGAFVRTLRTTGVKVDGGIRRARSDAERAGGPVVAQHSVALAPVLRAMNVYSRNVVASTVFKLCGVPQQGVASWASGEAAVRAMARARDIDDQRTRIVDGSGLSPENRTTAALLVQLLAALDGDVLRGPLMYDSLAVSGVSGTLRKRLRSKDLKGRVHAKTGTLNDVRVRGLAGYIDGRGGHPGYVFAILLNGRGASTIVVDDIVRLIARR